MSKEVTVDKPYGGKIEGVKPEVAQGFYKLLENGRRYFGSSGASLTHSAYDPKYRTEEFIEKGLDHKMAEIGLQGERDTTEVLKKWMEDKPEVVLVDSVHIRGWGKEEIDEETGMIDGGDTDHLLFIGSEVILIDTKRWKKKSRYGVDEDGNVVRANKSFPGSKVRITEATHMWLKFLHNTPAPGHRLKISPIVLINNEEVSVYRNLHWFKAAQYRLVEIDRLIEYLNDKYETIDEWDKTHISSTLVAQAAVNTVKPYDPYDRLFSKEALKNFR